MPQSIGGIYTNGYTNGHSTGLYEMQDQQIFLFTSESVGEGHPGELIDTISKLFSLIFVILIYFCLSLCPRLSHRCCCYSKFI